MHPDMAQVLGRDDAAGAARALLARAGGPLQEALADGVVRLTFAWIGDAPSVALQCGLAAHDGRSVPMTPHAGNTVWTHVLTTTDDALVSYRYVIDDPFLRVRPEGDAEWQTLMLEAQTRSYADPHNPQRIEPLAVLFGVPVTEAQHESVLALPGAPSNRWFRPHDAPAGSLDRFTLTPSSAPRRAITVYRPHGIDPTGLPLVVLLDGSSWLTIAGLPRALDAAIAAAEICPALVAFVHEPEGSAGLADRTLELSCNADHAQLLATELIPALRERYPVDRSPAATVLGGASLGGLQSMYTAMEYPELIGNVLSVSGSYWYGTERDGTPEWLTRRLAVAPRPPVRVYQQIGRLEDAPLALSPGVSHLVANRHLRDMARAKGLDLTYEELTTAHDVAAFRVALMRGMETLLPCPPSPARPPGPPPARSTIPGPGGPPRWSTDDLYSGVDDPAFLAAFDRLERFGDALAELVDRHGIRDTSTDRAAAGDAAAAAELIEVLNAANDLGRTIYAFIDAHLRMDGTHAAAQALMARMGALMGRNRGQLARFAAWLAAADVDGMAALDPVVFEHAGWMERLAQRARHQMGETEEELYAELSITGAAAWTQLHASTTARLEVDVALPDGVRRMPMAQARSLATHGDERVRHAAHIAELEGWERAAPTCAAALNAIKGEAVTVNRRRGWPSALDTALFANAVDRDAYDAMTDAVVASLPDFRRFLRTKARLHRHDGALPWWDLVAPLPGAATDWSWADGIALVRRAYERYGGALPDLLTRAVAERWIDAEPRSGKAPGASSMPFFADRSLVFLNWTGALEQVLTLAHELGHAFHNAQLSLRPATLRDVPMSLAETASIFCETLLVHTALDGTTGAERLALLDVDLCGHTQTVVDIHTRVLFETELFDRRARRTLGPTELGEIMVAAQATAFGDALRSETRHPYMWAVKRHYYTSHFYNWQYTFGLLLGLGLFAHFLDDPVPFRAEYEAALSWAGRDTAAQFAARFGIDLADGTFWRAGLDVLRARIADYEHLAAATA